MAKPKHSPALVKFVRRAIRREPGLTLEQLEQRWRAQRAQRAQPGEFVEVDAERLRTVYAEEAQRARQPDAARPRSPTHGRTVLLTVGAWIAAHLVLLAALALPAYLACQRAPPASSLLGSGCGLPLGLTALAIGWLQPVYGVIIAFVIGGRRTAIAQGLFIAVGATTLLFTVVCFGGAVGA